MRLSQNYARHAIAAGMAILAVTTPLQAQTIVAGNIGPGNTVLNGVSNSWRVGYDGSLTPPQQFDVAVSFMYTGAQAATVQYFSWAVNYFSGTDQINASWYQGTDISTAAFMGVSGAWPANLATSGQQLFLQTGGGGLVLDPGQTYWIDFNISLPSQSIWGVQTNDQGQMGSWSSRAWDLTDPNTPVDMGWTAQTAITPAFNVVIVDQTTTPEPASLVLVATGLLGVIGVARRKRA